MINRFFAIFSAVFVTISASSSSVAYSFDFIMENDTNQPIVTFMANKTTESNYHIFTDVYIPANGGKQKFTFQNTTTGDDCYTDMRLSFQGGHIALLNHVNLCDIKTIAIHVENGNVIYYPLK